jgi:putative membrane protein
VKQVETQPERTGLAWQRTALGVLAVAGLIAHGAFLDGDLLLVLLSGAVALLGLALLGAVAPRRYRRMLGAIAAGGHAAAESSVLLAVGIVVVAALAAACAVLVHS